MKPLNCECGSPAIGLITGKGWLCLVCFKLIQEDLKERAKNEV